MDKARLFNKYFYSVFTKDDSPPNISDTSMPIHVLQDIEICCAKVFTILSSLDVTKSAGLDDINPKILNFYAIYIITSTSVSPIYCQYIYQ